MTAPKKGKAGDSNGIRAGDTKTGDDEAKGMIRQSFNDVLRKADCSLGAWRRLRIKVIYKKGDVEEARNYRLLALYLLFSTLLYNRLYSKLDNGQAGDQGGFRRSCQTLDHPSMYRLLEQRCREWGVGRTG